MAWTKTVGKGLLAFAIACAATFSLGQGATDFPTLKGNNQRTGANLDPLGATSGRTRLRWFFPFGTVATQSMTVDNTDFRDSRPLPGGPYDTNPRGVTTAFPGFSIVNGVDPSTTWASPQVLDEAPGAIVPVRRAFAVGTVPADQAPRFPAYFFTSCVPSLATDFTRANTGTAKHFEWNVTPPAGVGRQYGLYVNIPVGQTRVGGVGRFSQRYYVFEVSFTLDGRPQRLVDVVDTQRSGFGLVRLGSGGTASGTVFPSDGSAIRIRLFNTVPRDQNGRLMIGDPNVVDNRSEEVRAAEVLVYADAVQATPSAGVFDASPVASGFGDPTRFSLTTALNEATNGLRGNEVVTINKGVVTHFEGNTNLWPVTTPPQRSPLIRWRYSPLEESEFSTTVDNTAANATNGWNAFTGPFRFQGTNYLEAPVVGGNAPPTQTVTYSPNLDEGSYDIYAYFPGDNGTNRYARSAQIRIEEGTIVTTVLANMSAGGGWVRLGNRRYAHGTAPLRVVIQNTSSNNGDAGRRVYADAVRFVGVASLEIRSTPVHTTARVRKASGVVEDTRVVIVADERGRIHCLDFNGNSDGTTTEYWSYPSTPNLTDSNWADPNLVEGIDGTINSNITPPRDNTPVAQMPRSFDLSSALVQRIGTRDFLYIASTNGRVYCIDMEGRGDYNTATRLPGSTRRVWSWPNDFPGTQPAVAGVGAFRGSLVFVDSAQGASGPTILVPAREGRLYALDALGTESTRSTTTRWAYPLTSAPALPEIVMTPAVGSDRAFFGTARAATTSDGPAKFYAVNLDDGTESWVYEGEVPGNATNDVLDDFRCGPVFVSSATMSSVPQGGNPLAGDSPVPVPNVVYALNHNSFLYGFVAETGELLQSVSGRPYRTRELGVISNANLGFTVMSVPDTTGTLRPFPLITVPTTEGHFYGMFARAGDRNVFSDAAPLGFTGRLAYGRTTRGSLVTSLAFARNWLFAADSDGFVYGYDDDPLNQGIIVPGIPPSGEVIAPNDPVGQSFRAMRIRIITPEAFRLLRNVNTQNRGPLTFDQAVNDPQYGFNPPAGETQLMFEWGQTANLLVYGFPYLTTNTNGNPVVAPVVTVRITSDGRVITTKGTDSHQFASPASAPPADDPSGRGLRQDGYAVIQFTFQNGGPNAVPPGGGEFRPTASTAGLGAGTQATEVQANPQNVPIGGTQPFGVANPLALFVPPFGSGGAFVNNALSPYSMALTPDPYNPESRINGSPNVTTPSGLLRKSQLQLSTGYAQHGGSQSAIAYVMDRSLMALIRPEGLGNIRAERSNLQWQGGASSVFRPLNPSLYPRFEDLPANFPNTSLDYPDIGRENVRITKDPDGVAENPLLSGVTVLPPALPSGRLWTEGDALPANVLSSRALRPTRFQVQVNVPRYQPVPWLWQLGNPASSAGVDPDNLLTWRHDSNGDVQPQGYFGRMRVFVDSSPDGRLNDEAREAYRAFNYSASVVPDQRIRINTPTLALGDLPGGAGYTPGRPSSLAGTGTLTSLFNPWNPVTPFEGMYKPFVVQNDGNVNLLNVRLAKGSNITADGSLQPWSMSGLALDPFAWMNGSMDLWSDLDPNPGMAPVNPFNSLVNQVILQKPRVLDRAPTELSVNPVRRANPNLGTNGFVPIAGAPNGRLPDALNQTLVSPGAYLFPPGPPRVAVSAPLGTPVGSYASQLRVIDDVSGDPWWNQLTQTVVEPYSDPMMTVTYNVTETRLTNANKSLTSPMIDPAVLVPSGTNQAWNPVLAPAGSRFGWRNSQPAGTRDAFGTLIVAWNSDRPVVAPGGPPVNPVLTDASRIYLATVRNDASFAAGGFTVPDAPTDTLLPSHPLRDLNYFAPQSDRWFRPAAGPYPTVSSDVLFGLTPTESVVGGSERYSSPAFAPRIFADPMSGSTNTFMAFVGNIQRRSAAGRTDESRVFVTRVGTASDGTVDMNAGGPPQTTGDASSIKSKPALANVGNNAILFYGASSAGQSEILSAPITGGTLGASSRIDFGSGFMSVGSPSASTRFYAGVDANGAATSFPVVDLAFTGRLRGRPNNEVYLARLLLDAGLSGALASSNAVLYHPEQVNENLLREGSGLFRARGVVWATTTPFTLIQRLNNTSTVLLRYPQQTGDPVLSFDRQTGLISGNSALGGRIVIDPNLGTIRMVGGVVSPGAQLRLTYTPAYLRVTEGGTAGYSSPTVLFDNRVVSDLTFWRRPSGLSAVAGDNVRNHRFLFTFGRSAAGAGQTTRPYLASMRLGLRLPSQINMAANGVIELSVTGNVGPYEIDVPNGRVYFTAVDEGRQVTVQYRQFNEGAGAPGGFETVTGRVSFVAERREEPVPISQAVNEGGLAAFLDPFTFQSTGSADNRRPALIWMLYASSRDGVPDIYLQSMAPRFVGVPTGR